MVRRTAVQHFLSIADFDAGPLARLLERASDLKRNPLGRRLEGRMLALLFEKASLRTRVSFEVAMRQQGGASIYLSPAEVGLGEREPIKDVARVLSRMVDAVALRTYKQSALEEFSRHASIPVINALTDSEHPCQTLADLLTIREHKGDIAGKIIVFIGDGNNVANSLMIGAATLGAHVRIACPPRYEPPMIYQEIARRRAQSSGGSVTITHDVAEAADRADVLYTDVWTSMGQERETTQRHHDFQGYSITQTVVERAAPDVIVMHDLPAHRDEEISDEVFEAHQQVIFDQAENRLHAQKALLLQLLGA
ncbi:MAG: ornithine carbamoyltransferase [Dehalococcoidia bacterium]|nr:ornithine carbamoyltransferase [Dehalococcoidia bacterium]